MAGYPPPYPPPTPPYGPSDRDWKYQRRILRDQARAQRDQFRMQMRGTRRRSILGPLVVVLVGVVFLLLETGHLHNERLWDWYGRWWPLLLIVAGIVLLAEWAIDRSRPSDPLAPYSRRSIGGGVILLVILLAASGIAATSVRNGHNFFVKGLSINPDNLEEFLGDKHESDETLAEAFPAGGTLTIDNPHGDVTVSGTSPDAEVHLSLHKQVYSHSDADAERKMGTLSPGIRSSGNVLALTLPSLTGATASLSVTAPANAHVTINANHGDVHVDAIKAPVTVTANHGDVTLSGILGTVVAHINNNSSSFSAHSITGPVALEGHGDDITLSDIDGAVTLSGDFYGTTHLEHITHAVQFHTSRTDFKLARLDGEMEVSPDADLSADRAVGPVVLTTRNRNITLERISGDVSVTNRNGSVDLTSAPPLGNVTVENRNGSVNLTLPDQANFVVAAETDDGDLVNDFALPARETDSRKVLNGTVGKGGSLIRINTSQGDVSLKKASIAPLPVAAPRPPTPPGLPQLSVQGDDGSSVYVGKDGVRVISGPDGSSVIVGKDGVRITSNANGSSVYNGKDGTRLTEGADGTKVFIGRDGTHYTEGADGSKVYTGRDGSRIAIDATGTQTSNGPGGGTLTNVEVRDRLRHAQDDLRKVEQQRDAERKSHQSH